MKLGRYLDMDRFIYVNKKFCTNNMAYVNVL